MPWADWGISDVFCAYDIYEAKRIISTKHIHILLCDIEMPMGSGIDLIEWIHAKGPNSIVCILLTCHPDFNYAKRAVELGCSNYLLKPAEEFTLGSAVIKAENEVLCQERRASFNPIEHFWRDILDGGIRKKEDIEFFKGKYGISNTAVGYRPVTVNTIYWGNRVGGINSFLMEFIFRNITGELYRQYLPVVVSQTGGQMLLILQANSTDGDLTTASNYLAMQCDVDTGLNHSCSNVENIELQDIRKQSKILIQFFDDHYDSSINVSIGKCLPPEMIIDEIEKIKAYDRQCAFGGVVFTERESPSFTHFQIPTEKLHLWANLFSRGEHRELYRQMEEYFHNLKPWQITRTDLNISVHALFREMIKQTDFSSLSSRKLREYYEGGQYTWDTIPGLLAMMNSLAESLGSSVFGEIPDAVEQVKTYVSMNIDREITREQLAAEVNMNPDYLNRIFKRSTGMSLREYIGSIKTDVAKELLENTDFLIGEVGGMVGYASFSSFTTFFKKSTGMTPESWREQHRSL